MKHKGNNKGTKLLAVWGVVASGLLLTAALAGGVESPIKNAERQDCYSTCASNFRYCLSQGNSQSYCQAQYQTCVTNCSLGGSAPK